MKVLRSLLGFLLLIISIFYLVFTFGVNGIVIYLSDKQNLLTAIESVGLYEKAPDLIVESVIELDKNRTAEDPEFTGNSSLSYFTQEDLKKSVGKVITPDFLRSSVETMVGATYDFLYGREDKITFSIDLKEVNTNAEKEVTKLLLKKFEKLPVCTSSSLEEDFNPLESECKPKNYSNQDIEKSIKKTIQSPILGRDKIESSEIEGLSNIDKDLNGVFSRAPISLFLGNLLGLLVLAFAVLIIPWQKKTAKFGIALLVSVTIALVVNLISTGLVTQLLSMTNIGDLPPDLTELVFSALRSYIGGMLSTVRLTLLPPGVLAIVLIVVGYVIFRDKEVLTKVVKRGSVNSKDLSSR